MVSQSFSANSWKSIPFSRKWREHSRILWNPDTHGTSPPGCFWWCYTNKTSPILWMVRLTFGRNPYDECTLTIPPLWWTGDPFFDASRFLLASKGTFISPSTTSSLQLGNSKKLDKDWKRVFSPFLTLRAITRKHKGPPWNEPWPRKRVSTKLSKHLIPRPTRKEAIPRSL